MFKKYAVILALLVIVPLTLSNVIAAGADDARQFVDGLGKKVLDVVNASGGGKDQKQKQLEEMFVEHVDIPWMGQFVLGRAWQKAPPEQRDRYLQAYRAYLLAHYTSDFAEYTGAKYTITDIKSEEDGQFTVNMQINTSNQSQNTLAGYRLRSNNGQLKIIDIIVEGVSLITTERAEFADIAQQKGMDGLIQSIHDKTQTEKQPTAK